MYLHFSIIQRGRIIHIKANLAPVLIHANTDSWELALSVVSLGTHCLLQVLGENVLWISQYQSNFK